MKVLRRVRKWIKLGVLLAGMLNLSGCATIVLAPIENQLSVHQKAPLCPYSGVVWIKDNLTEYPLALLDLPFSFTADTCLLLYTVPLWLKGECN